MAEIVATGNLGADSEIRYTQSGSPVLSFRIADSKSKKKGDEWEKVAEQWLNVTVWGSLAEFLGDKLSKGVRVKITGEFYMRQYDGKNGPGVSLDVTAWGVQILTPPSGRSAGATNQTGANTHQPGPGWGAPPQQQQQQQPPAQDPWQSNPPQGNGGGWGNPQQTEPPF